MWLKTRFSQVRIHPKLLIQHHTQPPTCRNHHRELGDGLLRPSHPADGELILELLDVRNGWLERSRHGWGTFRAEDLVTWRCCMQEAICNKDIVPTTCSGVAANLGPFFEPQRSHLLDQGGCQHRVQLAGIGRGRLRKEISALAVLTSGPGRR